MRSAATSSNLALRFRRDLGSGLLESVYELVLAAIGRKGISTIPPSAPLGERI